jgi:ABC-type antimicrobial peptide transport system permease subunit
MKRRLFWGSVGSISLFVGAVGVMNIMIVNVTQRTSEIGVRRAVGAPASLIRRQFLLEALVVTGAGGSRVCSRQRSGHGPCSSFRARTSRSRTITTALIAMAVILVTGIVAGVDPAIRASRISPVEALRHE